MQSKTLNSTHQRFIQNVSHELRTPLSVIYGYAELLYGGDLGELSPQQQAALELIKSKSHELRSLVERIGILLTLQGGERISLAVDVAAIVKEVVRQRQRSAAKCGVELRTQIEEHLPPILGDPYQLQEAVDGLVENGIKFTPAGGRVEIRTGIEDETGTVQGQRSPCAIYVEVVDTGIGIAEEHLEHLFSGFYQVDASTTRRYGGLGIGLTVAQAVVEAHGGSIAVESQIDQGSCFKMKIPVLHQPEEMQMGPSGTESQRILVVDDEINVAYFLQAALEILPHCRIYIATCAEQAMQLFEQQPFDLLITDYKMPGTSGLTLGREIRRLYPDTVIVMITAYADELVRESTRHLAIQHVLDKPVKLTEIRALALEILERSGEG